MTRSAIPPALVEAYRAAEYHVHAGSDTFRLFLGRRSTELARCLAEAGQRCAVFITAHNPYSEPTDEAANEAAHRRLLEALADLTPHVFAAEGKDPTGEWPPEPGWLALGVDSDDARSLGRAFGQNAIVWAGADAVPELILLR